MNKPISARRLETTARTLLRMYGQRIREGDVQRLCALLRSL